MPDPDTVARVWPAHNCRWSFVSGAMNSGEANEKFKGAAVLLFRNLFELSPRLKQLFPFKTETGDILDAVRNDAMMPYVMMQ